MLRINISACKISPCIQQVVARLNTIMDEVLKKWYYKDGFINSMMISGCFIGVTFVPAFVSSSKRTKRVFLMLLCVYNTDSHVATQKDRLAIRYSEQE